jgi:RNA polymerase sigma factor (sigma-70 family)
MLNGLRRLDPVSERVRRTLRRAQDRRFELAQERGTLPSLAALEPGDLGLRRARSAAYLQTPLSLDGPLPLGDEALADSTGEPSAAAAARLARAQLREALALLPERQRRILALHYGSELSLRVISSRLDVSPQRVSQLHLGALVRLRKTLPAP